MSVDFTLISMLITLIIGLIVGIMLARSGKKNKNG